MVYFPAGKEHSNDFSRLIAQVRGRLQTSRQTPVKQEGIVETEETHKTQPAGTFGHDC